MNALASIAIAAIVIAAGKAETSGSLKINGKDVPITHVCAMYYDNEEGAQDAPEVRILLTNGDAPISALEAPVLLGLDSIVREDKVNGVMLRFDPKKDPLELHGAILYPPKSELESLAFFSASGAEYADIKYDEKTVSGTTTYESTSSDPSSGVPEFSFKITFNTPVTKCPPITHKLTGADAAKSGPVQAMLAFQKALRSGDFEAAAKVATPAKMKELQNYIDQAGKDQFLKDVRSNPDPETMIKQITKVLVRGKSATIIAEDNGTMFMSAIQDGETWKVQ
jgi:hypothetical protein